MAKVLCVLYDDPVDGYPTTYARDDIPKIERYPGGQTLPTPEGDRLHARRAARQRLRRARPAQVPREPRPHARRDLGQGRRRTRVFERELPDAEIVISQPFWPAYLTAERIAKAPKLKLAITAGIGSDHVDLRRRSSRHHRRRGHLLQQHQRLRARGDDDPVAGAQLHPVLPVGGRRRLEHRRLRRALLRPRRHGGRHGRRRPHRPGRAAPAEAVRRQAALHRPASPARRRSSRSSASPTTRTSQHMVRVCDVVTINAPLHPETEDLFNDALIAKMKRGAYLVNTARGKICDRDAVVRR